MCCIAFVDNREYIEETKKKQPQTQAVYILKEVKVVTEYKDKNLWNMKK